MSNQINCYDGNPVEDRIPEHFNEQDNIKDHYCEDFGPPVENVILFFNVDFFEVQLHGQKAGFTSQRLITTPFIVINEFDVVTGLNHLAKRLGVEKGKSYKQQISPSSLSEIEILRISKQHGKQDVLAPRIISDKIYNAIEASLRGQCMLKPVIEKVSKDEFYVDVSAEVHRRIHELEQTVPSEDVIDELEYRNCYLETPQRMVRNDALGFRISQILSKPRIPELNYETEKCLVHGAAIALKILDKIETEAGLICSAGISSNKLLAKIACTLRKPDALTILPQEAFQRISYRYPIDACPGLGGKLGFEVQRLFRVQDLFGLAQINRTVLRQKFGSEDALKMHQLAIGYDTSKVVERRHSSTLKCGITFSSTTRMMYREECLIQNIRERFTEMREHILYEVKVFGDIRIPKEFCFEILTNAPQQKSAFRSKIQATGDFINSLKREADELQNEGLPDHNGNSEFIWETWDQIYHSFMRRMRAECEIDLFNPNEIVVQKELLKIGAINLTATYGHSIVNELV